MSRSRIKSLLKSVTPRIVQRAYRPRILLRDWKRGLGDKLVTCNVNGLTIRLGVSSEIERWRARTYATKEPETLAWLDANLRKDDVLFDLGANIGLYTLYAARRCPESRVYAFEPESHNYARLCRNVYVNGCQNVVPCNFAISGKTEFCLFEVRTAPGLRTFEIQAGDAQHGLAGYRIPVPDEEPPIVRQGVMTMPLDVLVEQYGLPQPALIKIDVDGVEERIVEGSETVLSSPRLRSVLVEMEVNPEGRSPIEARLVRHGFRLATRSEWVGRVGDLELRNYIFTR